jgi:hypothetical protein
MVAWMIRTRRMICFVVAEGVDLGGSLIQRDAAVNARCYSC